MNLEELREKIVKELYTLNDRHEKINKALNAILSIGIGGEVVEESVELYGQNLKRAINTFLPDKFPVKTRPRLLRDCVKEER